MIKQELKPSATLPNDGLEAILASNPDMAYSWVTEAPLRLVAATLRDLDGRTGKAGDLKDKLEARVLRGCGMRWKDWWAKVLPDVKESGYFYEKSRNLWTFLGTGANIPESPLGEKPKPAKVAKKKPPNISDWRKWLRGAYGAPPPGRWPTKNAFDVLAKWSDKKTIEQALTQTVQGAEEFLASGSASSQAAAGWLEAVSRASLRWRELMGPDASSDLASWTGQLFPRLTKAAGYTGESGGWLRLMVSLLLAEGGTSIVKQVSQELGDAIAQPNTIPYDSSLYILLSVARVLAGDANRKLYKQRTSYEKRLDEQRIEYENQKELDEQRIEYEKWLEQELGECRSQLEQSRAEEAQLCQQNQTFRAQMASGREESRLEVRQDMLLEIGDILQRAYRQERSPEDRLHDMITRIPIALQAGGAEPLGTVGDTMPYDPRLHHSTAKISSGTLVRLCAPGVVVRGGSFGERVVLKASVIHQSEVSKCKSSA